MPLLSMNTRIIYLVLRFFFYSQKRYQLEWRQTIIALLHNNSFKTLIAKSVNLKR